MLIRNKIARSQVGRTRIIPVGLAGTDFEKISSNLFLLKDDFNDNLVVGTLNGSRATPGGVGTVAQNTRTVVDTGGRVSLTGGNAVFAAGGVAGDPGIWWGGISNVLGLTLITKINNGGVGIKELGWDNNQAGSIAFGFRAGSGGAVSISLYDVAVNPVIGLWTAGEVVYYADILRGSGFGHYAFAKSITNYPQWRLLYPSVNITAIATVYPHINSRELVSYEFMRVPLNLFIIPVLAYDTFTRANLARTDNLGPDGQAAPALPWTNQEGTIAIVGNTAIATVLAAGRAICTVPVSSSNLLASVTLIRGTTGAGIVLRYENVNNYVYCWHNGANLQLVQRVAGVETILVNAAAAYGAGRIIQAILDLLQGSAFYNNAKIGATVAIPASSWNQCGLIFFDLDSTLDNFTVYARGNEGQYNILDQYIN